MNSTTIKWAGLLTAASVFAAGAAIAEPDNNTLVIEGQQLTTDVEAPEGSPLSRVYSGWRFRSPETQAFEMDDFENPAFPAVEQGEALWNTVEGEAGKSCATCHNDASETMKGVRASMPKWNEKLGKPHTLETQINACRTENMKAEAWKWEAPNMLAMTAYVGLQSRGMPVNVQTDGPMQSWNDKGKELYYTRVGQLDMSCANCHEDNYGKMIRADHLSQGQINGFPTYRLKWGGVGSIHRRFSGCMKNIRATPYKRGSDEFIALELYLASRGAGLSVETPAVRN
ncbi:MAG: sulfur oxidation c-type cytochrome SoxA [Anderseniella sp.]|nr:sulfur oxidation c-type cytochrome SoxA [Anderseniella sp.]